MPSFAASDRTTARSNSTCVACCRSASYSAVLGCGTGAWRCLYPASVIATRWSTSFFRIGLPSTTAAASAGTAALPEVESPVEPPQAASSAAEASVARRRAGRRTFMFAGLRGKWRGRAATGRLPRRLKPTEKRDISARIHHTPTPPAIATPVRRPQSTARRGPGRATAAPARAPFAVPLGGVDRRPRRSLAVRDPQRRARPPGHPPVGVAHQAHQRRHEQGADDGGVEDDSGRDADRERLDLVARGSSRAPGTRT